MPNQNGSIGVNVGCLIFFSPRINYFFPLYTHSWVKLEVFECRVTLDSCGLWAGARQGPWWEGFRRTDSTDVIGNLGFFGAARGGDQPVSAERTTHHVRATLYMYRRRRYIYRRGVRAAS